MRTLAAVLFLLGVRARVAGTVAGALGLVALSQDPFAFIFTLYTLFLGTIVLAWTDATSQLAWRPDLPVDQRSSATLLCVVLATIYGFSGLAKVHHAWLDGSTLLAYAEDGIFAHHAASLLRAHHGLRLFAAWATMALELGLGAALLVRRLRFGAILVAASMHVVFEGVARPDVMGFVMLTLLLGAAAR